MLEKISFELYFYVREMRLKYPLSYFPFTVFVSVKFNDSRGVEERMLRERKQERKEEEVPENAVLIS